MCAKTGADEAIRFRSLSRIAILPSVQREEVAGHLFEDQRL
jgi:hypothetical protein